MKVFFRIMYFFAMIHLLAAAIDYWGEWGVSQALSMVGFIAVMVFGIALFTELTMAVFRKRTWKWFFTDGNLTSPSKKVEVGDFDLVCPRCGSSHGVVVATFKLRKADK